MDVCCYTFNTINLNLETPAVLFTNTGNRNRLLSSVSVVYILQELRNRRAPRLHIHLYGKAATFLFNHYSENLEKALNVEVGINLSDEFHYESLAYNIESEGIAGSLDRMIPEVLLQNEVLPAVTTSGKIGVYTCGPKPLMDSVQKACEQVAKTVEIYLHRETFEW
jgi:ferredoxin-NADP reductase